MRDEGQPGLPVTRHLLRATLLVFSVAAFGHLVGFASPLFALTASLCVLGLLDLVRPLVRIRLPRSLRPVQAWEIRSALYRVMGVPMYGALLRNTPLRLLNRRVYLKGARMDLSNARIQMEDAEAAHFWGGLATVPYLAFAWSRDWRDSFAAVIIFNVVANLYPILHLRSVRARLERAAHRRM